MGRKKINPSNGANEKRKASRLARVLKNFAQFISNSGTLKLIKSKKRKGRSCKTHLVFDFFSRWYVCTPVFGTIFFDAMICSGYSTGYSFVISAGAAAAVGKLVSEHKRDKSSITHQN